MAGVKRKATSSAASALAPRKARAPPSSAPSSSKRAAPIDSDDGDDDDNDDAFDDDENLMAKAMNGGADESGDDDNEDDDDDDAAGNPAMLSDEDMDGGFEDIEGQDGYEDSEGGFEDLENGDGAESDASQADASGPAQQNGKKGKGLYSLPSAQEVQGLREAGELFSNNIFKLKLERLLPELRPRTKTTQLEAVLRRLKPTIEAIPAIQPASLGEARRALTKRFGKHAVQIPFCDPRPRDDAAYKFGYEKPSRLDLVGSWPLATTIRRPDSFDVDLAVTMPSSLLTEKDHLNFRYSHKRAFYLAVLAAGLASSDLDVNVSYQLFGGDPRRPVLVLSPKGSDESLDFSRLKAVIRIHVAREAGIFAPARLAPSRNSVRFPDVADDAEQPATPIYNAVVLADELYLPHLVYLHGITKACPAFADAAQLLKTWAFQRGFGDGNGKGFSKRRLAYGSHTTRFVLTMMMAHLLQGDAKGKGTSGSRSERPRLLNGFSSYQLFRGTIDWLASHDFASRPTFMKPAPGIPSRSDKISDDDFATFYSRALVDPTGSVNLLAGFPAGTVDLLQYEAKQTVRMLNNADGDHFEALFMQPRTAPVFTFDETATIQLPALSGVEAKISKVDHGSGQSASAAALSATASRALGVRAKVTSLLTREAKAPTWPSASGSAAPKLGQTVELGIVLDADQALRMVEHGPVPEDKEGSEFFKAFWGEVAELRRFRDGQIRESIVWAVQGPFQKWTIPRRILRHVLHRHHSIEGTEIAFQSEGFDGLLDVPAQVSRKIYLTPPEERGFQLVQTAFETLAKHLREAEGLPLGVVNVAPSDAGLRSMSVFLPGALKIDGLGSSVPDWASHLPVHDVVITVESSGRWPDDVPAIQAMKAAFYERLATVLPQKVEGIRASVAFDVDAAEVGELSDRSALEVVLPTGIAFRARIHHERERVLLERIIADKRGEEKPRRDEASLALRRFDERFIIGPRHHSMLSALQNRFIALSDTIRLAKRWLSSQLLSDHVPSELVELLCGEVFISPDQGGAPTCGVTGFVRVLRRLASWRWREEPLVLAAQTTIELPEGVTEAARFPTERRNQVDEAFRKARAADPSMNHRAWLIATEHDTEGKDWGEDKPAPAIAAAVCRLAQLACALLDDAPELGAEQIKALFVPSLSPYDVLLHLEPTSINRYHQSVTFDSSLVSPSSSSKSRFANAKATTSSSSSLLSLGGIKPGLDVLTEFVALLRSLFDDTFRLHHDENGGLTLGLLFNPSLRNPRPLRLRAGYNSRPTREGEEGKAQVVLNVEAVLDEIRRLGTGIVRSVEVSRN